MEDLKILLDHYALNNPLAIPRIIKRRAPWADSQKLQDELSAYGPRKYKAGPLGKLLGFTGAEWRVLRLRTIAPIDMTKEERRAFCQRLANERKRKKLGRATRQTGVPRNPRLDGHPAVGGRGDFAENLGAQTEGQNDGDASWMQ